MKYEEKFNLLHDQYESGQPLLSKYELEFVLSFAGDRYPSIRALAAKALIHDAKNAKAAEILWKLAKDPNKDVRLEAVDSLRLFPLVETYVILQEALSDSNPLVRAYAAYGYSKIGQELGEKGTLKVLQKYVANEKSSTARIGYYEGLYLTGDQLSLGKLMKEFSSKNYRDQCFVIHALEEVMDFRNIEQIRQFLMDINTINLPRAVESSVAELRKKIEKKLSMM